MQAAVLRPAGSGPFPLAVINHGSSQNPQRRLDFELPAYAFASRWFVSHGFLVVIPLRPGHGATAGPYIEDQGGCDDADYTSAGLNTARSIRAAIQHMLRFAFVRKSGVVVVGQSAGGWGALAMASENPPEVRAIINFSGGRGGRAYNRDNFNCAPDRLVAAAAGFGKTARIPTLWLYSQSDRFFGPELASRMAKAFTAAGGKAELHLLPPLGEGGHNAIDLREGLAAWSPIAESFLAKRR